MSFYSLLGYRSFITELEVKRLVLNFMNENSIGFNMIADWKIPSIDIINTRAVKFFESGKQQTWIVATKNYTFCIQDDIEIDYEEDCELIRWFIPIKEIKNDIICSDSSPIPEKVGVIDFGSKHKGWYYSKKIFGSLEMIKRTMSNLMALGLDEVDLIDQEIEKKKILETYSWIKVPKYKDDPSLSLEERFKLLEEHHIKETTFLIQKIREVVSDSKISCNVCDCCGSSNGVGSYSLCNIHSPRLIE